MTSNPNFKGTPLFDVEYLRNGTRWKHSCNYGMLLATHMRPTKTM